MSPLGAQGKFFSETIKSYCKCRSVRLCNRKKSFQWRVRDHLLPENIYLVRGQSICSFEPGSPLLSTRSRSPLSLDRNTFKCNVHRKCCLPVQWLPISLGTRKRNFYTSVFVCKNTFCYSGPISAQGQQLDATLAAGSINTILTWLRLAQLHGG